MLSAVLLVLTHFETFRERWPSYHEFFSFKTIVYMWIALGAVKVIHEFGHGLSCKAFGGEVHEMGLLFLCLSPCMYCNVSDAWTLPNKWKRIIISFAGIYVELMIAAIATWVWWNTPSSPFVNYMALALMVVCSVSTVVFNGNPLMRFDGYYILADWLEIPNLRDRCNRYIQRLAMEYCLGIEVQPEPYMSLRRRVLFVTYAVVSYIYRWVVTFYILYFIYNFLKPYKLGVISAMLALLAAGSMVGWPIYRLGKAIHKRGRLPDMKSVRVTITACVLAAVLFGFFLIPFPVSRIREAGLVQVQPKYAESVFVQESGTLEAIYVKEGDWVRKGAVLAQFKSPQLQDELLKAQSDYNRQSLRVTAFLSQFYGTPDPIERDKLRQEKVMAETERTKADNYLRYLQTEMPRKLILRAPRDGVVMDVPQLDDIGKRWEKGVERPFCKLGEPRKVRVLVPVSPANYRLILEDQQKYGKLPPVTIRVRGRDAQTWTGQITQLPEQEAKEIPIQLSNKGGGPLAVKPGSQPEHLAPQTQVFLVGIDFDQPDDAIAPGALAQVKIHCTYRTCAWWVWRTINSAFDLGGI
jgi:putative peptide zinc metalloprotease protein